MGNFNDIMLYFMVFAGVYVLYYAIRGTGKVYENEYPKAMQEDYRKFMRKFCWIVSLGILPLTALEFVFESNPYYVYIEWTNIGFVLICVVFYLILFKKRFGKFTKPQKPGK